MTTISTPCPTCKKPTPHRTSGVHLRLRESDGRVSQSMECCICSTLIKVYFTEGTNEFQKNLEEPTNSELMPGEHDQRTLETGETVHLTKFPGRNWFIRSYDRSWVDGQVLKTATVFAENAGFASHEFNTPDQAYDFAQKMLGDSDFE